jgi:hypothetical protein
MCGIMPLNRPSRKPLPAAGAGAIRAFSTGSMQRPGDVKRHANRDTPDKAAGAYRARARVDCSEGIEPSMARRVDRTVQGMGSGARAQEPPDLKNGSAVLGPDSCHSVTFMVLRSARPQRGTRTPFAEPPSHKGRDTPPTPPAPFPTLPDAPLAAFRLPGLSSPADRHRKVAAGRDSRSFRADPAGLELR